MVHIHNFMLVESDQPSWTETLATGIYSIGTDNVVLKIDPNQQYQKISVIFTFAYVNI